MKKWLVLLALTLLMAAALDVRLAVRTYTVESSEISSPVTVALLTDLHGSGYGAEQEKLRAAVAKAAPDLVLLGGDIWADERGNGKTERLLAALGQAYECYYVTGNHEYRHEDTAGILRQTADYGITVLHGEAVETCGLLLYGVDDPAGGAGDQLSRFDVPEGRFTLLLAHRPERVADYAERGFDLALAGHAHGGQWRIPGLINGVIAPHQGLFPAYAGGEYQVDDTTLIVSRGLSRGRVNVPRIFNRPELVIVEVIPK